MGGASLATLMLLLWGLLVWFGFALIYHDFIHLLKHSEVALDEAWWSAVYYSGYVASALGLGDVVPTEDWLRLVTVGQAFTGFILVTTAVSYILALYQAQGDAVSCATDLALYLGEDDADLRERVRDLDRLDRWAEGEYRRLTSVLTSYSQYPILHYFRPPDPRQSLVVQLGQVIRLIEIIETELEDQVDRYPSIMALRNAMDFYLEEVSREFTPGESQEETGQRRLRREQHEDLLSHLAYPTG